MTTSHINPECNVRTQALLFHFEVLMDGWKISHLYIVSASGITTRQYQKRWNYVFVGDSPPNISGDLTGSSMQYFPSCSATSATSWWPSFGSSTPLSVPFTCHYNAKLLRQHAENRRILIGTQFSAELQFLMLFWTTYHERLSSIELGAGQGANERG
jgi:hypothetical protein